MKAYEVVVDGFDGMTTFYAALTRGQAHNLCFQAANDAGYNVKWTEIRVKRQPGLDELASEENTKRSIGWIENGVWYGDIRSWRMQAEGVEPGWG